MRFVLYCVVLSMLLPSAAPAVAQDLYAINFHTDALYQINTSTGQATLVGALGVDLVGGGAAFDVAGRLWGVCKTAGQPQSTDDIYLIDLNTGAATHQAAVDRQLRSRGIVFGADGVTLYTSSSYPIAHELFTVDTATGVTTLVGSMSIPSTSASLTGATGYGHWLFAGTDLYTIDLNTTTVTFVGASLGGATLAFDPLSTQLFSMDNTDLYRIDPVTGTPTLVGPLGVSGGWSASAFQRSGTIAVEERAWSEIKELFR